MNSASRWLPIAFLAGALVLLFLPVVVLGESFVGRDVTPFFYPMKRYLAESVASGRFPFWNPHVAGGEPFFATLQPGVLYPGSLLLYFLPFPESVDWLVVLHYAFAALGWFLFLRDQRLSRVAATFGALAFVLGGFYVSLGNFLNNLQTASWIPWILLGWSLYLRDRTPGRLLAFSAASVAAFLGGEPQILALVLLVVFAWGLTRPSAGGLSLPGQVAAFAAAGLVALLVAGVQLVPFVELVGQSVRTIPQDLSFGSKISQEPTGLLHLAVPPALGGNEFGFSTRHLASSSVPWLLSLYPGVLVAVFWWRGLGATRRTDALLWGGLAGLGLLLALGAHTPIYRLLFEGIAPLRALRYPEKFAVLMAVGVPLLAGRGVDRWLAAGANDRVLPWTFGCLALLYGAAAALLFVAPEALAAFCVGEAPRLKLCDDPATAAGLYAAVTARIAGLLTAAGLAAWLPVRGSMPRAGAAWLIVALAAFDLGLAHRAVNPSAESEVYTERPWVAQALGDRSPPDERYRYRGSPVLAPMGAALGVRGAQEMSNLYFYLQGGGPNTAQNLGWLQADGLQGVELRTTAWLRHVGTRGDGVDPVRFLRLTNVRYYEDPTLVADSLEGLETIARHPEMPLQLLEVRNPMPRAFVASGWERAAGMPEALRAAFGPAAPDPSRRRVVIEGRVTAASPDSAESLGRIVAATWEAERVRLIARTTAPTVMVLLDRWYPGWRVTVNGEPAELLRANGVFRAVEVPAGETDVEFVFDPPSVRLGAGLTLIGVGGCIAIVWWSRRREEIE